MSTTPMPQPDDSQAPSVQIAPAPLSNLGAILGTSTPQAPINASDAANGFAANDDQMMPRSGGKFGSQNDQQVPYQPGSRLASVLSIIAKAASAGIAGIPAGKDSFVGGLAGGARAEQAQQSTDQAIKFKSFDDSIRAANLHNQDLQKQNADDAQKAAQQAGEDFQREAFENNGGSYDTHPNSGTAVTQTLAAQTSANGAATIAPGTHVSANGSDILMPSNTPQSLGAQVKGYQALQGVLPGLPTLPGFDPSSVKTTADVANARQDLGKHLDIMQHLLQGYNLDGSPYNHKQLNDLIPAYQAQIDSLTKSGNATPYQLGTLKNTLSILKANESTHQDAEDSVANDASERKIAEQNAINNNKAANTQDINDNKPQKAVSDQWQPGATTMQKNKADLAENMVFNANSVASLLMRRPDIVGAVAGRFTTLDQMKGTNDPDIVSLATDIENIAKANAGLHGQKAQEAVTEYANTVLNHFKNGPAAIYGGLKSSTDSVQTFIDAARPNTYKTHSKNGGAVRAMVPGGQQ